MSDLSLEQIEKELDASYRQLEYNHILREPLQKALQKIRLTSGRRKRSKYVYLEFVAEWTGYTSKQRKIVGKHYRKVTKEQADKIPNFLSYKFSDNTFNEWRVEQVPYKGKSEGSYSNQIDELLESHLTPTHE